TAKMFSDAGVPVHDADATVHRLYEHEAVAEIEAAFPRTTNSGKVDRAALRARIKGDSEGLKRLESIVHPLVRRAEHDFLARAESSGAKIAVLDIPLLFETGGDERVDAVVVVTATPDIHEKRMRERGIAREELAALLARQMPDAEKQRR